MLIFVEIHIFKKKDVKWFLFVTDDQKHAVIKSPHENDVCLVDLGEFQSCHLDTNICTLNLYKLLLLKLVNCFF